ncbi:hypothetical protein [Atopococcus tabaci]|uniref:hypothetical protein n=1 Tax=Atopococcus tabaci TaxID=269774 RepID=UPI0003FD72F2|nr:hypothetical protein [Atopococcus tabaci]
MNWRTVFLVMGLVLSAASKWLQLRYSSVWGDVIILPAAVFFVLAVLLSIPSFQNYLAEKSTRNRAKRFALFSCLTILSFQLFTMMTFGRGFAWGWVFLVPVLIFAGSAVYVWRHLSQL